MDRQGSSHCAELLHVAQCAGFYFGLFYVLVITLFQGEGWGSTQSTEMVLNNMFYIMAKFGDDFQSEMEKIWAALCKFWPTNLKVGATLFMKQ